MPIPYLKSDMKNNRRPATPNEEPTNFPAAPDEIREVKDHLTVVETVYHRQYGEEATAVESRFTRELQTQEQSYTRRLKVEEEWRSLDTGWIIQVGMLVIQNTEGKFLQQIPSEADKAEALKKTIEIKHDGSEGCWLILPGESIRVCPSDASSLRIRCQLGTARFTVHIFPK